LLGQLAKGELTPEAFLKLVEQSVRSAAKGANLAALEQALWGFLTAVGPELEASGSLVGLGPLDTQLRGRLRFTPEGPEATYSASRLILAPPGAVTSTWAPAVGSFSETRTLQGHERLMFGVLQKLDVEALGRPGAMFVEKFPTSGYFEYTRARRYGDDLEVGVRLGVRLSTSDLAHYLPHEAPKLSAGDTVRNIVGGYQDIVRPRVRGDQLAPLAELVPPLPTDIPYDVGFSIFAHFK
jgi:hypothetical protein